MLAACQRMLGLGLLLLASGCAMCDNCDDYTHGSYGGRWERIEQCYGRVGSVFTPEVGHHIEPDVLLSPTTSAKPEDKPADSRSTESTPGAADSTPESSAPNSAFPSAETPTEGADADDSAPKPPSTVTSEKKSTDNSVLRQRPRPVR